MPDKPRGPLRGIRRVQDAGAHWHVTLTCGHSVYRPKADGRPRLFARCHCRDCLTNDASRGTAGLLT